MVDRQRRHQLIREQNQRIAGMTDDDIRAEIEGYFENVSLDDSDELLWLALLLTHRANRLEETDGT